MIRYVLFSYDDEVDDTTDVEDILEDDYFQIKYLDVTDVRGDALFVDMIEELHNE